MNNTTQRINIPKMYKYVTNKINKIPDEELKEKFHQLNDINIKNPDDALDELAKQSPWEFAKVLNQLKQRNIPSQMIIRVILEAAIRIFSCDNEIKENAEKINQIKKEVLEISSKYGVRIDKIVKAYGTTNYGAIKTKPIQSSHQSYQLPDSVSNPLACVNTSANPIYEKIERSQQPLESQRSATGVELRPKKFPFAGIQWPRIVSENNYSKLGQSPIDDVLKPQVEVATAERIDGAVPSQIGGVTVQPSEGLGR